MIVTRYWQGKTLSEAHRQHVSAGLQRRRTAGLPVGRPKRVAGAQWAGGWPKGVPRPQEQAEKIQAGLRRRREAGLPLGKPKGVPTVHSEETRRRLSAALRGNPKLKLRPHPRGMKGKRQTEKFHQSLASRLLASAKAQSLHPNNLERCVLAFLIDAFPDAGWKFNPGVVIGGKIPDFVRSDELKVVADVHGDYWHRHDDRITVKKRCQVFAQAGVALVVIWEREFNSKPWLLTRRVRRAEKLSQARQGGKVGL